MTGMPAIKPRESMTGFAAGEVLVGKHCFQLSVKSVNQKGLRLQLIHPLGDEIGEQLRQSLQNKVTRGYVELKIQLDQERCGAESDFLQWREQCKFKDLPMPTWSDYYNKQRVAGDSFQVVLSQDEQKIFSVGVSQLLEMFVNTRIEEGLRLSQYILDYLQNISEHLQQVKQLLPDEQSQRLTEMKGRIEQLVSGLGSEDRAELIRELAVLMEKLDVSEECDRLDMHLRQFESALVEKAREGKFLDFLCQEINRELTTLSNKCHSASISYHSIEMKTILEKIREQVQNLA